MGATLRHAPALAMVIVALALPVAFAAVGAHVLLTLPVERDVGWAYLSGLGRFTAVPLALVASFVFTRAALLGRPGLGVVVLTAEAVGWPILQFPLGLAGLALMDAPRVPTLMAFGAAFMLPAAVAELALAPLRRSTPLASLGHLSAGALAMWLGDRTDGGWMEHWWEPAISALAAAPYLVVLSFLILRSDGYRVVGYIAGAGLTSFALIWVWLGVSWMAAGASVSLVAALPLRIVEAHVPRSVREARYRDLSNPQPGTPLRLGQYAFSFSPQQIKTLRRSERERLPDGYGEIVLEVPLAELLDDRQRGGSITVSLSTRPAAEALVPCGPGTRCQYTFPHEDLTLMYSYDGAQAKRSELTPAVARFIERHRLKGS